LITYFIIGFISCGVVAYLIILFIEDYSNVVAPMILGFVAIPVVMILSLVIMWYFLSKFPFNLMKPFGIEENESNITFIKKIQTHIPRYFLGGFILLFIYRTIEKKDPDELGVFVGNITGLILFCLVIWGVVKLVKSVWR
jgi:hypothetical protein